MGRGGKRVGAGRPPKPKIAKDEFKVVLPPSEIAHLLAISMREKISFNDALVRQLQAASSQDAAREDHEYVLFEDQRHSR